MTAALPSTSTPYRPGRALAGHVVRQVRLGAVVVAAVAAGMSALVAGQYQTTFAGVLDGSAVQALAANPAIRILFGPPLALDDPGGFTVWRTGIPVLVLVSVLSLLAATRITRGEEDAGRSDLLLAGCVRRRDLITGALIAVAVAVVVIAALVAVALTAAGTQFAGALVHAGSVLGIGLTFSAVGTLAAQIMATRAAAAGLAAAVLGGGLLARMLADGVPGSGWLAWSTPFGLAGLAAPYAGNRVEPLVVLAAFPAVLTVATVVVAGHRDAGSGVINSSASRRSRTRLLRSVTGFAVRRATAHTAAWAGGIAAYFLLVGALVSSILTFLADNPRFTELAAGAGLRAARHRARTGRGGFQPPRHPGRALRRDPHGHDGR
ncbi:hypothetical protein [Amycolatopsis thermoflava]|uniref:hypothetical protein n=1 Tax=Amycolatopsis thermoflava TaxID=84480 RepID=UPI003EBC8D9B